MDRLKLAQGFYRQPTALSPEKSHDIFIYGVIGWHLDVEKFWNDLQQVPSGVEELNFYVHSPGGLVYEGYALLTHLSRLKSRYHTRGFIDGLAASMGSAIVVNMHETIASPTSTMIIHDPMFGVDIYGGLNRARIKELMEELAQIEQELEGDSNILAGVYARKTGLTVEQVQKQWMEDGKNHHFTPKQMLEAGLVDSIAEHEFAKPPALVKEDEDDWMSEMLVGMRAACVEGNDFSPYRGLHDKVFATVAIDSDNTDHNSRSSNSTKTPKQHAMKFASIAPKLGLDPNTGEDGINRAIDTMLAKVSETEKERDRLQGLVDQHKETSKQSEARVKELETNLRTSKAATVVEAVIEEAQKNVKGKVVNKNIREELNTLAVDQLQAEADGNEKMAANLKDYMQLLAKNNLVPVGENPDLTDTNGKESRSDTDSPNHIGADKIAAAKQRGQKKLAEQKQRWQATSAAL